MLLAKKWNALLPMGVFTQHCKHHQRICVQTCLRVLCELGLRAENIDLEGGVLDPKTPSLFGHRLVRVYAP